MKKLITLLLIATFTFSVNAQKKDEKKAIKTTIENFFKGFHKGDGC